MKAGRTTATHFARILGQLWLEVTGFVFLVLAAIGGVALSREYAKYQAGHGELSRIAIAIRIACSSWSGTGTGSLTRIMTPYVIRS